MERIFGIDIDNIVDRIREALQAGDVEEATRIIEELRPADQAEVFSELSDRQQIELLPELDVEDSADILEELHDEEAAGLVESLSDAALTRIVDEMEPDEAADLLRELPPERAKTILSSLTDPNEVRPLLVHPDESAGGVMTSEFLALRRRMTIAEALTAIRTWGPEPEIEETLSHFFVVDGEGRLVGILSLYKLITSDPQARIADIMDPDVIYVTADTDQEESARLMARYDLVALPVLDKDEHLLGIITHDDLVDVLEEEATEDIQRIGGSEPLDKPYLDTSVLYVAQKRIGWLLLLFITEMFTGTVLRHFERELAAVVALSFFIPLLIGTGGNAGSQTTATIIRSLAIGDTDLGDALRILWHEMRTGILLGLAMGTIGFIRALMWGTGYDIAIAVAIALTIVVLWANTVGSFLPLLAAKLHIDPAIVSGPFMSTLVDATGLFIYLEIAKAILGM